MRVPKTIIAALTVMAAAAGCDRGDRQLYAPPPWPADHTIVLTLLSDQSEAVQPPQVFGPGQVVSVDLPEDAQRLLALTYADADGYLVRCGATFSGTRARLPEPDTVFEAHALSKGGPLTLNPQPTAPPLELRYARCEPDPIPACPTLALTTYPVLDAIDRDLPAITVFRGEIYTSPGLGPTPHQLYRLQGEAVQPVDLPVPLGQPSSGMRTLASDGDLLWATQGLQTYSFDANFRVQSSSVVPFFVKRLIAEANGGPVLATGDADDAGGVVDLTGQLPSIHEASTGAVLAGPDRRFVLLNGAIMHWQADAWVQAYRFDIAETYLSIGGDHATTAAASELGELLLRDEASQSWYQAPPGAAFGSTLRVVLPMGPGRVLVAGNDGFIGLWDVDRWCVPPARSFTNALLNGVVHEGNGYLSTSHIATQERDTPMIVKVEIVE